MAEKSRILIVGGTNSIYMKAKKNDFHVTVIQAPSEEVHIDRGVVDELFLREVDDRGNVALAQRLHEQRPFICVLGVQESGGVTAAEIVETLGVIGNPLRPVRLVKDKLATRKHLAAAGIPNVPFVSGQTVEDYQAFGDEHGWPVVVKGRFGGGSAQVWNVDDAADLAAVLHRAGFESNREAVFAEAFVAGREISVEVLSWRGRHEILALTDKITTGSPEFVELGHLQPAVLSDEVDDEVRRLVTRFLDSIGQVMGPSHTEVMLSPRLGPVIIESHTRTGGDFISDLVKMSTGIDIFDSLFAMLRGADVDLRPVRSAAAGVRYLELPTGTVASVSGKEEVLRVPGIVHCEIGIQAGDLVGPLRKSRDRTACVVGAANSRDELDDCLANGLAHIEVAVDQRPVDMGRISAPIRQLLPVQPA